MLKLYNITGKVKVLTPWDVEDEPALGSTVVHHVSQGCALAAAVLTVCALGQGSV